MDPTLPPAPARHRFRPSRRRLWQAVGGLVLVGLLLPLLQWRRVSGDALRQLLRAEMTRVSDSVYVLQISPVHLRLFPGAISFDSAYVTTDTIRRVAFPHRPVLRVGLRNCQLSGVSVWKLLRKQGLYGSLFRCSDVHIGAQVAATDSAAAPVPRRHRGALEFLKLRREFHLPSDLPVISVETVEFPDIRLDLTRERANSPTQRVALEKFSARFDDVVIDPSQPVSERRPLFARQIALAAEELAIASGDASVSFARMAANLGEGSFTLLGLRVDPGDSASVWFRRQKFRRPWVKLAADSVRFAGIDLARLIQDGTVVTRQIIIGGLDATIETDASLPVPPASMQPPVSPVHAAAAVAATGVHLEADTVELIDGTVRYTGHRPERPTTSVWVPHVAFQATDILIDPELPPLKQRPLLARVARLSLDGATYTSGDSLKSMTMGQLRLQVGDSVLVARQLTMGPAISDAAWMRRQRVRHTLGRARVDSVVMRGVNYDRLVVHTVLDAREMAVSGVRVRLQKDMALPPLPPRQERARPALDSTLADLGVPTRIGRLTGEGDVTYVEHHRGLPDRQFAVRAVAIDGEQLETGTATITHRPLLAQRLTLVLTDIDRTWGKVRSLTVGTVRASFSDSTLSIDSVRIAPHYTPVPQRAGVHVSLDSMRFSGVNFVRLADGGGVSIQRAVFGDASVDAKVDAGVAPPAHAAPDPSDSTFTGFSFPIAIQDLQVLRGHGHYTRTQPGTAPFVLSLGRVSVVGRSLALQRGVTRPLLEQDLLVRVADLTVSGAPAHGHARSAVISLRDSAIAFAGIRVRTGSPLDTTVPDTTGANSVMLVVDSLRASGIHFRELARGQAVRLSHVVVGRVDGEVQHASQPKDSLARAPDRETGQQAGIPVAIADLRVPFVRLRYIDTRPDGTMRVYTVKKASINAEEIALNPGASRESRIRRISRHATVTAEGIVLDDNPMSSFTVGSFFASLSDSVARVRDVYIGPTVPDSVWVSRQDHRHDRIRVQADSVVLAGLDLDRLLLNRGLWLRHGRVFRLGIDAYTDKNLKASSVRKVHSSPQQDVQSITFPFGIDTLSVVDGEVAYHELEVGKPEPGTMSFSAITATITGFTSRGIPGQSPPLRIETHSTIFGAGRLDAYAVAPLTSAGFDVVYHGRLGPMPAVAINQFAEKVLPVTLEGGQFSEVTFSVGAKDGHAIGTIVPVYRGLKVKLEDGRASLLKRVEYSVLTFVAREFVIRHNNPGKNGQPPRVGVVDHTFAGESIVQFLWYAVRGGIQKSIMR